MKKKYSRFSVLISAVVLSIAVVVPVSAATISELEKQQQEHQSKLNQVNSQITEMENEQEILEEEISDLDAEIVNMFTSIELLEEEISEKEESISVVEAEIKVAEADYEKAKEEEEKQYEEMKIRVKYMYEKGDTLYMQLLLESADFSEMLNKADYVEKLYEYDRTKLEEYKAAKNAVAELQASLEEDKRILEREKAELESTKAELEEQKAYMDTLLAKKKQEASDYDVQIAQARKQAQSYKNKIKEDQKKIRALQEEERRKAEEALKAQKENGNSGGNSGGSGGNSGGGSYTPPANGGGSATGQQIASYACQFVGNPYVSGGTSLTNGADCSGFTYRVYADFGYSIPRTSYAQRNAGKAVDYANAQPGDIICYSGHVALYIGNGKIVHASTQKTGIKISNAQYREILAVRRIV